jgi:hypothetical protein
MKDFLYPTPITDFRNLGTGRKVVVANEPRERILFTAAVLRNCYNLCRKKIVLDTGSNNLKTFYVDTQTVDDQKVVIFSWSPHLEDVWQKQSRKDIIEEWLKTASLQDVFSFRDSVKLAIGKMPPQSSDSCFDTSVLVYLKNYFCDQAMREIRQDLELLSLVELQRLVVALQGSVSGDLLTTLGRQYFIDGQRFLSQTSQKVALSEATATAAVGHSPTPQPETCFTASLAAIPSRPSKSP